MFNSKLKVRIAELERSLSIETELNKLKSFEIARLKDSLVDARKKEKDSVDSRGPIKAKRMVGLKFRALFNGLYQPTEFKTGPGPCGKTVAHFTTSRTERELTIHQHHTDGSQKDFEYRLSDIDGRVQYDYEQVTVYGEEAERERALQAFVRIRPRVYI